MASIQIGENGPAVITDKNSHGIYTTSDAAGMMSATVAPMPPQQMYITNRMPPFGPTTVSAVCPSCHEQQWTKIEHTAATKTHIIALLLCGLCCCCIPYCIDSCKNVDHHCSKCGAYLGTYKN